MMKAKHDEAPEGSFCMKGKIEKIKQA